MLEGEQGGGMGGEDLTAGGWAPLPKSACRICTWPVPMVTAGVPCLMVNSVCLCFCGWAGSLTYLCASSLTILWGFGIMAIGYLGVRR